MILTDDAPTYVWADLTLDIAVNHYTRLFLETFTEASAEAAEEAEEQDLLPSEIPLPVITAEQLREFLVHHVEVSEAAGSAVRQYADVLILKTVVDFARERDTLDMALHGFLKGSGEVSDRLYVNDPTVMRYLEERPLETTEIMLMPLGDYYAEPPIEGDDRTDCLMGVICWHGAYLCRPALVRLPDIEERMMAADAQRMTSAPVPNVKYVPSFGVH